jgi:hypothetical protein
MKKTIIALLALSSVSYGATTQEIDKSDSSLKAYWNFDESNALTKGSGITWSNLPVWNESGYGTMLAKDEPLYTTNAGLKASEGFTISFDIKNALEGTLLSVATADGLNQPWRACSITLSEVESKGTSLISAQFLGNTDGAIKKELTLSAEIWTTLTLVVKGDSSKDNLLTLSFYVNGNLVGISSTEKAKNFVDETANKLAFGLYQNKNVQDGGAVTAIDNILVYNRALTANEIKNLAIPEPTTATLSLLALAGLAARRRRK